MKKIKFGRKRTSWNKIARTKVVRKKEILQNTRLKLLMFTQYVCDTDLTYNEGVAFE